MSSPTLIVTFRGQKVKIPLERHTTVQHVKELVGGTDLPSADMKLMIKGKVLSDPAGDLYEMLITSSGKKLQKTYQLMAAGLSQSEAAKVNQEFQSSKIMAPRIRDDLSEQGTRELDERKRQGQIMLHQAASRTAAAGTKKYGFGKIEILPGLPNEQKAHEILSSLTIDPGILACMAKHEWNVGALTELYPDGKVGESAGCVMGLNENKGQRIKLRIRTDDLQGFRKIASIRKVLFHELAHNVHSEHDGDFFMLMRQIEQECNDMDWTKGEGLSAASSSSISLYQGGTFRLGGGGGGNASSIIGSTVVTTSSTQNLSPRELRLRAAMQRMTVEEEEIQFNCGCAGINNNLFLPPQQSTTGTTTASDDKSTASSKCSRSSSSNNKNH